jgi:hypothetical protein
MWQENYREMVNLVATLRESYTTRLNAQLNNIKQVASASWHHGRFWATWNPKAEVFEKYVR